MEKRGLTEEEAKKRLEEYGSNELKETKLITPLKILFRQIKGDYIIYLLTISAIISFFVQKDITAYTIIAVILLVIIIGFIQEYKAERAIKALKKMLVPISTVIRNGKEIEIKSSEIVPGDLIVLRNGEKIPADCIIIEEKDLLINESMLTGESSEVKKKIAKDEKKYSDENLVFTGTYIVNGKCIAKAIHTGMNTRFGKISGMISTSEKEMPLQNKINTISKYMSVTAIIFSVLTGIVMLLSSQDPNSGFIDILIVIIALSVSAFPEGLPVVMITALSSGAYKMALKNAIVNRMSIIETLGETTVICSDKTGTITKGEMTVKKILCDNRIIEVSGTGFNGHGDFLEKDRRLDTKKDPVINLLIKSSTICNDARIERTGEDLEYKIYGNPTESALMIMAAKANLFKEDLKQTRIEEIPFNSERKIMSVLSQVDDKKYIFSKGAPEILLKQCKKIQRYDGEFTLTEKEKNRILNLNKELNKELLRTIAVAYKKVNTFKKDHFEEELVFLGIIGMEDPPREEIKDSIKICLNAGIKVKMITGDNKETAMAIAKQIGLKGEVMEGYELEQISELELSKLVDKISIFARVKPEHKLKIIKALKLNGEIVTMTGDGVNDAPALKEAHIGVAMGKSGTDVSRSVADLTLKDDHFSTIVTAIQEGRTIFKNIRKFVTYQLSCNYAELSILLIGVFLSPIFGWKIPLLLALQILFMNLVTDDIPAVTLSVTPSSNDIMEEKPKKNQSIVNKKLFFLALITGMTMALIVIISFFISFNLLGKTTETSRTIALVTLICLEIANAFNFISLRKKVNLRAFIANKYLLYASLLSILATILIIYTPLNKIFETSPITITEWLIALILSSIIVFLVNIIKRFQIEY